MSVQYDVLGIGNAIVDVIARTEDDFLVRHAMNKGSMALIDEPRAEAIYASMGPSTQISGGSGANTISGVTSPDRRIRLISSNARLRARPLIVRMARRTQEDRTNDRRASASPSGPGSCREISRIARRGDSPA